MRRPLGTLSTFVLGLLLALTVLVAPGADAVQPAAPSAVTAAGPYDDTYYADAVGKEGDALRDALHTIISDQTKISYSAVWDALKLTDEDPGNSGNVIELYSGRSVPKDTKGGDVDDWNREHVWAKSHGDFGTATGPGTDGSAPAMGRLSVLLQWNAQDPPDAFELHRNDVIYEQIQHNRNPFIDHPEWAPAIFG